MGRTASIKEGDIFGHLTVGIGRQGRKFLCHCDCGIQVVWATPQQLRSGYVSMCRDCSKTMGGCFRGPVHEGDWLGGLQAIRQDARNDSGHAIWQFRCICGGRVQRLASRVKSRRGAICGRCQDNNVLPVSITKICEGGSSRESIEAFCKKYGYKLYDTDRNPPSLLYDPEA